MSSGESVVGDGGGSSSLTGARPRASRRRPAVAPGVLLAMAMFVLVVDTSLMNVSIAKVVEDLDTTVSGVQGAIALEALVSAAFILIGSKVGDLIGRKRAFVLGLLGYAVGALAMAFAQGLTAIIVFWAIIGGLGASLLLPAMQSLIHGNFQGAAQKKAYALVGAAAAIAAAVGPLLGGFLTTFLSWRVGFLLEVVVIAVVLSGLKLHPATCPTPAPRGVDVVGAVLSAVGMGGVVIGILVWQEGGEFVGLLIAVGLVALGSLARWLVRRKREGKPTLLDPDLFKLDLFRLGISSQMLQNIALGGAMIALPIYLQMVLEYNALQTGLTLAPLSLTMFATALLAGKRAGRRRPGEHHPRRLGAADRRHAAAHPDRPARGLRLGARHPADHRRAPGSACWCPSSTTTRSRRSPTSASARPPASTPPPGPSGCRSGSRSPARSCSRRSRSRSRRWRRTARCCRPPPRSRSRNALEDDARGDEQHPARGAARRPAAGDPGRDHRASTPTRGRSPCRSRCSSRSSPACSGCSTGSA